MADTATSLVESVAGFLVATGPVISLFMLMSVIGMEGGTIS